MATTRLGYTMKDFRRAYLGEIARKVDIYKQVFNLEKAGTYKMVGDFGTLEEL